MFLRDAELLVLDDLSSALDVTTEAELWRRLLARRGRDDLTCLVVSHSPVALANADQLVVLDPQPKPVNSAASRRTAADSSGRNQPSSISSLRRWLTRFT
jgi:ABC-type transport system involved in cytochrome bd biosynthesis fused ATPase/permease subunit